MIHLGAVRRRGFQAAAAVLVTISMTLLGAAALPASASSTSAKAAHSARAASPAAAASARLVKSLATDMTGKTADGRDVTATFVPKKFKVKHGQLVARGMLTGTIEGKSRHFHRMVNLPVKEVTAGGAPSGGRMAGSAVGACDILNLDLGPLDLNLLGLKVHLDEVVLDITAVPGAGNLLGNLLCAVAGLLDNSGLGALTGLLQTLSNLLNQILGQLP